MRLGVFLEQLGAVRTEELVSGPLRLVTMERLD
jgi:hypothetical protein